GRRVEKGLLAEPVAGEDQGPRARIPEREAEHAVEGVEKAEAALLVEMWDHLRIASRAEAMTTREEVGAQDRVVVDLAVADDQDVVVLVAERLRSAGDVDDRQPPASEADRPSHDPPVAVRPTVDERARHTFE